MIASVHYKSKCAKPSECSHVGGLVSVMGIVWCEDCKTEFVPKNSKRKGSKKTSQ